MWGPQPWFPPPCTPRALCPPRCWPVAAGGAEPSSDPTPGGLAVIRRQRGECVSGGRRSGGSLGRPRCLDLSGVLLGLGDPCPGVLAFLGAPFCSAELPECAVCWV